MGDRQSAVGILLRVGVVNTVPRHWSVVAVGGRVTAPAQRTISASNEIIGSRGEGELPADLWQSAMLHLEQPGQRLGPAEGFLNALTKTLRDSGWFGHRSPNGGRWHFA
jgi:hypothetical protein